MSRFTAPATSTSLPVVSSAATSTAAPASTTTAQAAAATKQPEGEHSVMRHNYVHTMYLSVTILLRYSVVLSAIHRNFITVNGYSMRDCFSFSRDISVGIRKVVVGVAAIQQYHLARASCITKSYSAVRYPDITCETVSM